jgi:hypothetical protein
MKIVIESEFLRATAPLTAVDDHADRVKDSLLWADNAGASFDVNLVPNTVVTKPGSANTPPSVRNVPASAGVVPPPQANLNPGLRGGQTVVAVRVS